MAKTATYKCKQCGTRLVVTKALEAHLSPIYCCGTKVEEVSSAQKKSVKSKKKVIRKKKAASKKVTGK